MKSATQKTLADGAIAGAIGYVVVAVTLALFNAISGKSVVYTAAALGSAIFYGIGDPNAVTSSFGPIAAFNALHLLTFLGLGLLVSWLVTLGERYPVTQYLLFALLLLLGLLLYAGVVTLALPLLGPRSWWQIGVATAAAVLLMTFYLMRTHPLLRRELREMPWGDVSSEETKIASLGEERS